MKQLEIDQEAVLQAMQDFNTEDSERASDAGESRQRIGEFLESTGINNKAFSHCRMVLRMKKDDKRQDWLRSMRALMPLMESQIAAIGTKDAFDVPQEAVDLARQAEAQAAQEPQAVEEAGNPDIAQEAAEFDAAMAEAMPEAPAGNVKKFKPRKAAAAAK